MSPSMVQGEVTSNYILRPASALCPRAELSFHPSGLPCTPQRKTGIFNSLCSRDKAVEVPIVLVQDLPGASFPCGLQADDDALWGHEGWGTRGMAQ